LYQNKPLLNFIEESDYFQFFERTENWADFENTPYRDWLSQWFVPAYDNMICKCVENEGSKSLGMIKVVNLGAFNLPDTWSNEAYQKTHRFFNNFMKEANQFVLDNEIIIHEEHGSIKLLPEIQKYINLHYAKILNMLPAQFDSIRQEYAEFLYDLVYSVFPNIEKVQTKSLRMIEKALKIHINIANNKAGVGMMITVKRLIATPMNRLLGIVMLILIAIIGIAWAKLLIYLAVSGFVQEALLLLIIMLVLLVLGIYGMIQLLLYISDIIKIPDPYKEDYYF